jgi:hypoxia up-regulated 1
VKKNELMVHLNGDEAMCFGAAFIAANSSSSFKVRKVFLTQHPSFEYRVEIAPLDKTVDVADSEITYNKQFTLFKRSDYLGARKTLTMNYDKNMQVSVFAVYSDGAEEPLSTYILDEIDAIANNDIAKKENSTTPKLTLQFELTRSHLLTVTKSELKFDELKLVQVKKPNATNSTNSTNTTDTETADEPEFEEKVVPHTYPIHPNETLHGVNLLSKEQKKQSKDRIKALEKRDNDKFKTDEAKNSFEALIYEFRSWLSEEEN